MPCFESSRDGIYRVAGPDPVLLVHLIRVPGVIEHDHVVWSAAEAELPDFLTDQLSRRIDIQAGNPLVPEVTTQGLDHLVDRPDDQRPALRQASGNANGDQIAPN